MMPQQALNELISPASPTQHSRHLLLVQIATEHALLKSNKHMLDIRRPCFSSNCRVTGMSAMASDWELFSALASVGRRRLWGC